MKKILIFLLLLIPIEIRAEYSDSVVNVFEMNIVEIQEAVDRGYLNYELLMKLYLDRIEAYDQDYNTLISLNLEALEEAKKMDLEFRETGRRSLLHGIPILIKDNIDVFGMPTTAGSKALLKNYPKQNADLAQKLIDSGAIVIGKTNMSEFAFSARNSYSSFGHVRNAYNRLYTSYGSSGGTTVAVALGFAPIGIGTDTNSSIRVPASAASLVGLRPTYGLVSNQGIIPYDKERDVAGPIARNSIDAYLVYTIIADQEAVDLTEGLENIKIGILSDFFSVEAVANLNPLRATYQPINQMINQAIDTLTEIGFETIELKGIYTSYYDNIRTTTYSGFLFCYDFNQYLKGTEGPIRSFSNLLRGVGYIQNLAYYNISCNSDLRKVRIDEINLKKEKYRDYILDIMDQHQVDVLLYPTTKNKIPRIIESSLNAVSPIISPVTGNPAITLAIGFHNELPYGMELLARHNDEEVLFKIGAIFEEKTNFYHLPNNAPLLFEINEDKLALVEIYDQYYENERYFELNEQAKLIFWGEEGINSSLIINYKNHLVPEYEGYFVFPQLNQINLIFQMMALVYGLLFSITYWRNDW